MMYKYNLNNVKINKPAKEILQPQPSFRQQFSGPYFLCLGHHSLKESEKCFFVNLLIREALKKKKKCNIFYTTRVWPHLPYFPESVTKIQKKKNKAFKMQY